MHGSVELREVEVNAECTALWSSSALSSAVRSIVDERRPPKHVAHPRSGTY